MTALRAAAALAALAFAAPAAAQELRLPANAELMRELADASGTHAVPVGPWSGGQADTLATSGAVTREAWRVGGTSLTTLQLMNRLAAQIDAAGFETLFRCEDTACGGFDFRFALPVLPPPEMFVDLFDYRFLSARQGTGAEARYITVLVSRSGAANYVQLSRIAPAPDAPEGARDDAALSAPQAIEDGAIVAALRAQGHVVLGDLDFGTGAVALGEGPFASLAALATFLKGGAERRIALVGHTDTVGGYGGNLALSRRRADAVMHRLIDAHGVPAAQMEADGIAYLAPRAPNTTAAGREANRRVEAVLLKVE